MRAITLVLVLGLLLAACGEDTTETTTTSADVPATASASTTEPSNTVAYEPPMRLTEFGKDDPKRGPLLIDPDTTICPTVYGGVQLSDLGLDSPGWVQHRACLTLEADEAFSINDKRCVVRPEVLVRTDPEDDRWREVVLTIGETATSVWIREFDSVTKAQSYVNANVGALLNAVYVPTQIYQYGPHSEPAEQPESYVANSATAPADTPIVAIYDLFGGLSVKFSDEADAEAYFGSFNGHGEFVRSIIEEHLGKFDPRLPDPATGESDRVFFDELSLAVALTKVDLDDADAILNLSLGTGCDFAVNGVVKDVLTNLPDNVFAVAAAGAHGENPPNEDPWFPASLCTTGDEDECDYIVSVGAAEQDSNGDWDKAEWSNDALIFAPGSMVLGNHPYTGSVTATGWNGETPAPSSNYQGNGVKWSGTSFAAPYMTAYLACLRGDPRQAWNDAREAMSQSTVLTTPKPASCP